MPQLLRSLILVLAAFLLSANAQTPPAWQPNTPYAIGAKVSYNSAQYTCLQAHTSQIGWEPLSIPALWQSGSTTGVAAPPPPPPTTASPVSPPSSSGSCWAPWSAASIYTGGAMVSYQGKNWRAAWWTQGEDPAMHTGVGQPWVLVSTCGTGSTSSPATSAPSPSPTTHAPTVAPPTAAPTTAPTTAPTVAPTAAPSPSNGSLPKRVLMGYWQNFNNGATCLRLSDVPRSYNLIAVAFASSTSVSGQITFETDSGLSACLGGYTDAQFTSDVQAAHAKGQKVVVSIGGQYGLLTINSAATASTFADSVVALMSRFGFDGVDIDLENGINPTYMAQALHQLAARVPGVIITLAPQTLDMQSAQSPYMDLALRIKDILTMSNTQYYNSGTMLGCNGQVYGQGSVDFLTALACIQLQLGLRADQIGFGLPASPSGAGSGYIAPTLVNNALSCLATGQQCGSFKPSALSPSVRGAMTWSINWDASNGYNFANTVSAGLAALP